MKSKSDLRSALASSQPSLTQLPTWTTEQSKQTEDVRVVKLSSKSAHHGGQHNKIERYQYNKTSKLDKKLSNAKSATESANLQGLQSETFLQLWVFYVAST